MSQMGFFDLTNRYAGLDAKNDPLLTLDKVVPWESFRDRLETAWRKPNVKRKSPAGRKPLDAVDDQSHCVVLALQLVGRSG